MAVLTPVFVVGWTSNRGLTDRDKTKRQSVITKFQNLAKALSKADQSIITDGSIKDYVDALAKKVSPGPQDGKGTTLEKGQDTFIAGLQCFESGGVNRFFPPKVVVLKNNIQTLNVQLVDPKYHGWTHKIWDGQVFSSSLPDDDAREAAKELKKYAKAGVEIRCAIISVTARLSKEKNLHLCQHREKKIIPLTIEELAQLFHGSIFSSECLIGGAIIFVVGFHAQDYQLNETILDETMEEYSPTGTWVLQHKVASHLYRFFKRAGWDAAAQEKHPELVEYEAKLFDLVHKNQSLLHSDTNPSGPALHRLEVECEEVDELMCKLIKKFLVNPAEKGEKLRTEAGHNARMRLQHIKTGPAAKMDTLYLQAKTGRYLCYDDDNEGGGGEALSDEDRGHHHPNRRPRHQSKNPQQGYQKIKESSLPPGGVWSTDGKQYKYPDPVWQKLSKPVQKQVRTYAYQHKH